MPIDSPNGYPKARSRIQRAFLAWFLENREKFDSPIVISRRSKKALELTFPELTTRLSVTLTHELGVHVMDQGVWWDALIFFEAEPIKTNEGYICGYCKPEYIETYSSREALWVNHMFEPFLAWVNETMKPAHWLMLAQTDGGGARWAEVHREKKDEPKSPNLQWIPLGSLK